MAIAARCRLTLLLGLSTVGAALPAQETAIEPLPERGTLRATPASASRPTGLDRVLIAARANRLELEAALNHFDPAQRPLEHAAMEWLLIHLDRHGHAQMGWFDEAGRQVEIPLEAFESETQRAAIWAELERERGRLRPGVVRLDGDLLSLREEELVQQVEFAVRAWRERPWTAGLDFETFCEAVLPHRVGDEALDDWRRVLFETFVGLEDRLDHPRDPVEAAAWIRRSVQSWVQLEPAYSYHLTDQSLSEMLSSKRGRVEDLAHLELMALRANAIPAVLDYTPAWAARRGNFAWTRLMIPGQATVAPEGRLAKVYRRTFAAQAEAWASRVPGDEPMPAWLADARMRDVTSTYTETQSIGVALRPHTRRSVLAFACVFDGQNWTPVAAGQVSDEGSYVRFEDLGVGVAYLPAWYSEEGMTPAGPPFVLQSQGRVRVLDGIGFETPGALLELDRIAPQQPAEGVLPATAAVQVETDHSYVLCAWQDGGWMPLDARAGRDGQLCWEVPPRRLILVQPMGDWEVQARPWTPGLAQLLWW
ncbi:MAG: hypothetical protein CMJ94_13840 [Planctomycetes bacterium]|nr:hypothetical protein [Planctomycetota bacterium]